MKKKIIWILALIIVMLFSGCSLNSKKDSHTKVIKVAFNQSEEHPQFKAMKEFGDKISKRTNGLYKVEVYPSELLGPQRESVELVQTGAIGMSIVANSLVENFNKKFSILGLPYIYDSANHQKSVFDDASIVGDLFNSTRKNGFIVLGAFHAGVRNVYTNKSINKPEDLRGLKIRIMESDTNSKMMKYMGGIGTPMAQSEVYTGIQSGVIDGGENNELIYSNLKHYEVAKYYCYTKHLMIPDLIIINRDTYNEMSKEHRRIFDEEIKNATDNQFKMLQESVKKAEEISKKAGTKFIYPDMSLFRRRLKPLHDESTQNPEYKELYIKIRNKSKNL
ncbi:TRAP transporter substrate-binding protein [Clostridium botulinum]|uniref:C4-dicarboxylate ABC transporter substrate-binding protein n=1 Tax=Clostridium botulinum C/D str. DC5 TaxID=1443128 RepID=A0A0A0IDZ6_CLOBO|nr:TRAP transporter substrate-binding protein [Clostridium botulinum]KEI03165.1 hypothetical protein Z952_08350 [Clostridium botulinum C/D str. BKT75002]KEI07540.1 hypothetical protein Z954_03550 [Clostridium botulinum C/D str. BKT2873]KGM98551.1 hypothetical protein Z955_11195 [Clostridium botulinum C/D str. DC5]KOC52089.1 hypothetical protein ADU89_12315 [Clostridium botulinum]KOC57674.1 hypothetical protein ADU90_04015 [Clostridium botulinum]